MFCEHSSVHLIIFFPQTSPAFPSQSHQSLRPQQNPDKEGWMTAQGDFRLCKLPLASCQSPWPTSQTQCEWSQLDSGGTLWAHALLHVLRTLVSGRSLCPNRLGGHMVDCSHRVDSGIRCKVWSWTATPQNLHAHTATGTYHTSPPTHSCL